MAVRRLLLFLTTAALLGPAAVASAATFEVTGAADTARVLHLDAPLSLQADLPEITYDGRLFGLVIEDAQSGRIEMLSYMARDLENRMQDVLGGAIFRGEARRPISTRALHTLAPGTYLLRLIGDGRGTVRLPITADPGSEEPGDVQLATDRPGTPARIVVRDPRELKPLATVLTAPVPFTLEGGELVSYVVQENAELTTGGLLQMCLRPDVPDRLCATDSERGASWPQVVVSAGDGWRALTVNAYNLAAGRWAADLTWLTPSTAKGLHQVLVVVGPS